MLLFLLLLLYGGKQAECKNAIDLLFACQIIKNHNHKTICCGNHLSPHDDSLLQCLPNIIIAGTQKSGSTALALALAGHPMITFAKKKEIHFFDRTKEFNQGVSHYIKHFTVNWRDKDKQVGHAISNSSSNITNHHSHTLRASSNNKIPLFAEATPYYIASLNACRRMSATLTPFAKFVVIMRHPAHRAFSEFQMHLRRLVEHNSFLEALLHHSHSLFHCLSSHIDTDTDSYNYSSFSFTPTKAYWDAVSRLKCLPSSIASSNKLPRLIASLKYSYDKYRRPRHHHQQQQQQQQRHQVHNHHLDIWRRTVANCFDRHYADGTMSLNHSSSSRCHSIPSSVSSSVTCYCYHE